MSHLSFNWIIEGKLAGHQAPSSVSHLAWLKRQGIRSLVRMAETHTAMVTGLQVTGLGLADCHDPVPDGHAPEAEQIDQMVGFITRSLAAGRPVGVSCTAGLGRTGTILACYLVATGFSPEAAIKEVRDRRPGSIETSEQERAIREYVARTKSGKC